MNEIEIYLQGEGIATIALVRVPAGGTVRDIAEAARAQGMPAAEPDMTPGVWLEDAEDALADEQPLDTAGIGHRCRVHVHRCRRVAVTVNFNGRHHERGFAPGATVHRVKQWAVHEFGLPEVDATEHALQVCGTTKRPDEDTHIGTLMHYPECGLCFDLVPKQRVQGEE